MRFKNFLILIIVLALIVIAPYALDLLKYSYSGSNGDFPIYLDPQKEILLRTSAYNPITAGGADESFNLANLFPLFTFYLLCQSIGLNPFQTNLIYLIFLLFIGFISFYIFIKDYYDVEKQDKLIRICLAITFVFAPYFIGFQEPGHISIILLFYIFPLLLFMLKKYIQSQQQSYMLNIFIIGLLISSSIANLSYLLILFSLLALFSLLSIKNVKLITKVKSLLVVTGVIILANLWWLTPTANYFYGNFAKQADYSKAHLGISLNFASKDSSILNVLTSGFEHETFMPKVMTDHLYSFILFACYISFFFFILEDFIKKKSGINNYYLFFILLICVGVIKAYNPPFNNIFSFAYDNISIMQVFRRPQSKIYWLFLFILPTLVSNSFILDKSKVKKTILVIISIFFISVFILSKNIIPFNIPIEYHLAKLYFANNKVQNILVFPSLKGRPLKYDSSVNDIGGTDFLKSYLPYPQISDDIFLDISLKSDIKNIVKKTISNFETKKDSLIICTQLKTLGITHILIRNNISKELINSETFSLSKQIFKLELQNKLLSIYTVNPMCVEDQIQIPGNSFNLKFNLPYFKYIAFSSKLPSAKIFILNNYDQNWILYLFNSNNSFLDQIFNHKINFKVEHSKLNGYANQWHIQQNMLGANNVFDTAIVIHLSQVYFFAGLFLSLSSLLLIFFKYKK